MSFKEIVDARTHARTDGRTTDAGHWRITKAHLSTLCSGELKKPEEQYFAIIRLKFYKSQSILREMYKQA